jgi:hypothetical protein
VKIKLTKKVKNNFMKVTFGNEKSYGVRGRLHISEILDTPEGQAVTLIFSSFYLLIVMLRLYEVYCKT